MTAMPGTWDRSRAAAISVSGAAGAGVRWAVVSATAADGFPWAVLLLNVAGSVLLGALLAEEWSRPAARLWFHDVGAIGFCGGLTTFSTFTVEIVDLARDGDVRTAVVYGVASVLGAIAGVVAGAAALRRVQAVTLALEEQL